MKTREDELRELNERETAKSYIVGFITLALAVIILVLDYFDKI